jgi:hypothetical protein
MSRVLQAGGFSKDGRTVLRAIAPSSVRDRFESERIRASTGNAVIDIASPRNRAKLVKGAPLAENRG